MIRFIFNRHNKNPQDLLDIFDFKVDESFNSLIYSTKSRIGENYIDVDLDDDEVSIGINDPYDTSILSKFYDLVKQDYILKVEESERDE